MNVRELREQEVTKTESHGGSKDESVNCGECSEHNLCEQRVELYRSSFEAIRRQQNFGWCQLKEASWRMSRGWSEAMSDWGPINFMRHQADVTLKEAS